MTFRLIELGKLAGDFAFIEKCMMIELKGLDNKRRSVGMVVYRNPIATHSLCNGYDRSATKSSFRLKLIYLGSLCLLLHSISDLPPKYPTEVLINVRTKPI